MTDRVVPMKFSDRRTRMRQIAVGKSEAAHGQKWPKIKLYVDRKALETKSCS